MPKFLTNLSSPKLLSYTVAIFILGYLLILNDQLNQPNQEQINTADCTVDWSNTIAKLDVLTEYGAGPIPGDCKEY